MKLHHHASIKQYFESLIDAECRSQKGATEAFCQWFDDLYFPVDSSDCYNPGVFEKTLVEWTSCFSEKELLAMQKFNAYFESIHDTFDVNRSCEDIERDPAWIDLISEAKMALASFR